MPLSPTAAQSSTSRANGALSRGPTTPEGKARAALNGTRHGLAGPFRLLPGEDAAAYGRLRAALLARHAPADAAEEHWVEELAFAAWRLRRLWPGLTGPPRRWGGTRPRRLGPPVKPGGSKKAATAAGPGSGPPPPWRSPR